MMLTRSRAASLSALAPALTPALRSISSSVAVFAGLVLLSAGAADATSGVQFIADVNRPSIGFDPSAEVFTGFHDYTILSRELAGPTGSGTLVEYTLDQCVTTTETGACGGVLEGDPYFSIVTLTLDTIPASATDGILLFLAELIPFPVSDPAYTVDDVYFDLDPTPTPFPLPTAPFDDFQTIAYDDEGNTRHYLGFHFTAPGQSVKFRYHADAMDFDDKTPIIGTLFSRNFVPEPSSALLLSVGLVGLCAFGRRR